MNVSVGLAGAVKGRLPHGWRIEALFDAATGLLHITSPDTHLFRVVVNTNEMNEYGADYKRTSDQLDQSDVEAKYDDESGVLRFDSPNHPEFWLEVNVNDLDLSPSKKLRTSHDQKEEADKSDDDESDYCEIMPWSKMHIDDAVLTLWPGTQVREADLHGPESVLTFFKEAFDIDVTPVGCVKTLPDVDESGENIEGTGGRHDFFFFVKAADVPKFAIKRFQFGMRWWSDVYFNNGEGIYPSEFRAAYPDN